MRYLLWAAAIFLTFVIQGRVSLFGATPNFTSVLAYYAGVKKGESKGIVIGSFIGILEDSLSGTFLGPNLLSKGLVGYLSSSLSGSFFRWTPLLGIIGISVLTALDSTSVFVSRSFFGEIPASTQTAVIMIAIKSLINAPLGMLLRPKG
jgi:rod shape-determining protein MreD